MKKLSCIALKSDTDRLIAALQKISCVQVSATPGDDTMVRPDVSGDISSINADISATKRAMEFLQPYDMTKKPLFAPPEEASIENFDAGLDAIVLDSVRAANELNYQIASLRTAISECESTISALTPWKECDIALPSETTKHTVTVCGTLSQTVDMASVTERLDSVPAVIESLPYDGVGARYVTVTAHKDDEEAMKKALAASGFLKCTVSASASKGYAKGVLEKKEKELEMLYQSLKSSEENVTVLATKLPDMRAFHDILTTRLERVIARQSTADTKSTTLLCGWIPKRAIPKAEKVLASYDAAYSFDDPEEGDEPPVYLYNNRWARNYEPVLAMYSLPAYGTFDPTMIMSIFYAVIFGLMFADVGYGLILLIGCLAGLRLLHPKKNLKRMLTMFAMCSVACIIAGVMFGGYFGDLPNALRENFGSAENLPSPAVAFDMIDNPMGFLVISVALGAIHMICGMVIKMVVIWKSGHPFDAIFDIGSWLILFVGIGLLLVNSTAGMIVSGIGVLMLIATQGRFEKNVFMKIGKGIMSLYDIVSYASDLLSYSRILALGLASAVIASVVNLLGTMGGPTVGGIILFIIVFLVGHVINFAVNILGTYVHTSRLQYIEFFGKFFEAGGKEFEPLTYNTKYVNLK